MACTKSLSMSEVASDSFVPLTSAVYCSASGTILGTMANYIAEFNATTGAFIRAVRTAAPLYGPMWICLISGAPYVSTFNDRSNQYTVYTGNPSRMDIYPINTSTLETGAGIQVYFQNWEGRLSSYLGPRQFVNVGNLAFFLLPLQSSVKVAFMDITNPLSYNSKTAASFWWSEQICTDGTNIYYADPGGEAIYYRVGNTAMTSGDYADCTGYHPIAVDWVVGAVGGNGIYAVCADKNLIYVTSFAAHTINVVDLDAATGETGVKPMRLRFDSVSNFLYIPVPNKDGVILYDPSGVIPTTWKTGFASPIDVVFTPSGKKFAVQSSETGLKEIEP